MFKDPVLIDTDGQIDSFWGLVLAKRYLDVKAVTVCGGKNNNPEDAFKNVPGFVKMAGLSCGVSKGSERCVLKKKKPAWVAGGFGCCQTPKGARRERRAHV